MTNDIEAYSPRLTFLSQKAVKKLIDTAMWLVESTGQHVAHEGALKRLKSAGCKVDDGGMVTIPAALVEKAIKSAPANISMYNREGELAMELGGRRSYYGTGSDLFYAIDPGARTRHQSRLEDVKKYARVADAMPNIDFIMSMAHPYEIPPKRAYVVSFETMIKNSIKPIVNIADRLEDLTQMWKISAVLRGGEQQLREKPFTIQYAEPISPLLHPVDSIDRLLFCAEVGMPVIYSPAPMAGTTAPITIAGHVVQGVAESLFGLVIHQLKSPGAPFLIGVGPAVFDMKTSQSLYNAPEYLMAYLAFVAMAKELDIPNWGYSGTSDAQIPDGQATFEAGLATFMAATSGSNLNHDVGYLDFGRTGSLEMIVMVNEMIDQIKRMQKGLIIDDNELALDVIAEVGHKGNFLEHDHTLNNFRSTQWQPELFSRKPQHIWENEGSTTLLERATVKLNTILDSYEPQALSEDKAKAIEDLVTGFQP